MFDMKKMRSKKDVVIKGRNAKWYDKNTRTTRLNEMNRYADMVSAVCKAKGKVLEIAPGPGYLAIELARRGFKVSAVELSKDFVRIANKNAKKAKVKVDFKQGNASSLPIRHTHFDYIICTAAFKKFKEPLQVLKEMYRVLSDKGQVTIIDMNYDINNKDINTELDRNDMKGFTRLFLKLSFKTFLRKAAYTNDELEQLIAQSPFKNYSIEKDGIGFKIDLYK